MPDESWSPRSAKLVSFRWEGLEFEFDSTRAARGDGTIKLPCGTVLQVGLYLKGDPPRPSGLFRLPPRTAALADPTPARHVRRRPC